MVKAARILIIEKNDILLSVAATALEAQGYSVVTTHDIISGLRNIYESTPDVIVMSNNLPTVRGDKAYRRVRQASYSPIIVLGNEDKTVETLEDGIDVYLPKPLMIDELVARVRSVLRRKKPQAIVEELSTNKQAGRGG